LTNRWGFLFRPKKRLTILIFKVPYLNDAVPTITCSRSALGALKFWWKIHSTTPQQFQNQAQTILQQADYLVHELTKKGIKAWKNPYSNTVFFERPSQQIIEKYDLAPDESPVFGKLAHIVVMQHINKQLLDSFVHDIKQWKAQ
jgi:histidine decarboxylase